jgi:hypothetical protein
LRRFGRCKISWIGFLWLKADPFKIWEDYGNQKQARFVFMKPGQWSKVRKFAVVRELKPEEDRKQLRWIKESF